ncbi:hypothetical protein IC582_027830 [Cucumis melo]
MNGIRYNTEHRDGIHNVQNSSVCLVANTMRTSSVKDKHPIVTNMSFYSMIQEIWELNYINFKIIMFKCNWVDSVSSVRIDELGFTLVNLKRIGHKIDSFILASQAKQVFFLEDPSDFQWHVVLNPLNREYEDHINDDELGDISLNCISSNNVPMNVFEEINDEDDSNYMRTDCDGIWILNENE